MEVEALRAPHRRYALALSVAGCPIFIIELPQSCLLDNPPPTNATTHHSTSLATMQAPGYPAQPPPQAPAAPKKYDGQNGMPLYDHTHGGHYGASAGIAAQGHAPPPETFSGHWGNVSIVPSIPRPLFASSNFTDASRLRSPRASARATTATS